MNERKWQKGGPPYKGWWNASNDRDKNEWSWWDGKRWSVSVYPDSSARYAAWCSKIKYAVLASREWSDYYPANARVPRIDPRSKT